jgi:Zn-finger nucleic acid-binding protein
MRCQECFELMSLKLDNRLTAEQSSKLDKLMQDCPDCERLWLALGESERVLQAERNVQVGPTAPDAFTAAVMRKVTAQRYVLGAHTERNPRQLAAAHRRAKLPHYPWSPGAIRPQTLTWASAGVAASLAIAAVTWLWLTSTLTAPHGNDAPQTRLQLLQRAITDVGSSLNWQLLVGGLLLATVMVGVWLALVSLARRRLGDWEVTE